MQLYYKNDYKFKFKLKQLVDNGQRAKQYFVDFGERCHPFGIINIFKKKQEDYDYIMVMGKMLQKQYINEIKQQLCFLTGKRSNMPFLKIFQVAVGQVNIENYKSNNPYQQNKQNKARILGGCLSNSSIELKLNICMQYLNYHLKDHIIYKKKSKQQISLKEYAYIIKTAVMGAQLYEEWSLNYLELDILSEFLFIKPNGQIKILPFKCTLFKECIQYCQCVEDGCINKRFIQTQNQQIRSYYTIHSKKKQSKYLKQIKNLSLQIFGTINMKIDLFVRTIPNLNREVILSRDQLQQMRYLQTSIMNSQSLSQIYGILEQIEDDYLLMHTSPHKNQQIQINDPLKYEAVMKQLNQVNSYNKQQEIHKDYSKIHTNVSRNIFTQSDSDQNDENNTFSHVSSKRRGFHQSEQLMKQPVIITDLINIQYYR